MAAREIRFATNRKPFEVGFGPDCEDPSTTLRLGRARVRGADDPVLDARLVGGSAAVEQCVAWVGGVDAVSPTRVAGHAMRTYSGRRAMPGTG